MFSHASHNNCGFPKKCGCRGLLSKTFALRQSSTNACCQQQGWSCQPLYVRSQVGIVSTYVRYETQTTKQRHEMTDAFEMGSDSSSTMCSAKVNTPPLAWSQIAPFPGNGLSMLSVGQATRRNMGRLWHFTSRSISSLLKSFMLNGVAHCVRSWTVCTQYLTDTISVKSNAQERTGPQDVAYSDCRQCTCTITTEYSTSCRNRNDRQTPTAFKTTYRMQLRFCLLSMFSM